jgi:hypothetical protein
MHVNFKVFGTGKGFFGDGFAIWYVRDPKLNGKNNNELRSDSLPMECISYINNSV